MKNRHAFSFLAGSSALALASIVAGPAIAQVRVESGSAGAAPLRIEQSKPVERAAAAEDRAWLGITVAALEDEQRGQNEIPAGVGIRVDSVEPGSPAAKAKLRAGDIIVQLDNDEVKGVDGLLTLVQGHKPGDEVKIWYFRGSHKRTANATLASVSDRTAKVERREETPREETKATKKEAEEKHEHKAEAKGESEATKASGPGFLGVMVQPLSEDRRKELEIETAAGVEIQSIVPGSPAEKAGLKSGDVILEVNGSSVGDAAELVAKIGSMKAGDKVEIVRVRDHESKKMKVTLGSRPENIESLPPMPTEEGAPPIARRPEKTEKPPAEKPSPQPKKTDEARKGAWLGVELAALELSSEVREIMGLEEGEGVRIDRVVDDSPAAKAGLQKNDVVLRVDGTKVGSQKEIGEILGKASAGQSVSMEVLRKGKRENVSVTLGSRTR
ncbi:MAG: PDZ domain-containing protein [Planctomycetes bacterium]|nr:PDZ domain-containing protein [Planctomycetota bacterium]MBI3844545.1 PDZ domain-containing protein [Planctomycetota bacterium]